MSMIQRKCVAISAQITSTYSGRRSNALNILTAFCLLENRKGCVAYWRLYTSRNSCIYREDMLY